MSLPAALETLPRFYSYREVLACFEGNTDQFLDAFCDGSLSPAVHAVIEETLNPTTLQIWLLRRLVRQMNELLVESRKPVEFPPALERR